ncbi:MAG: ice-binding family protein [Bacteroidota bacterium]
MKNNLLSYVLIGFALLCAPITNFGQAPDLGAASSFALFTAAGAFNNIGTTVVSGNIGTNVGAFTGFPPGVVIGQIHVADAISAQAATDVANAYGYLSSLTCGLVLGTTLGNGQVLTPNIYCLGAASNINGNLILDGLGNPNAIFIFQIDGALSTSTFATVSLINSAQLCNVYWQINGAFNLGDNSVFRGTVVAGGALNFGIGATLIGRGLTTAGAISTITNVVTLTFCAPTIVCLAEVDVSCLSQVPAPNTNAVAVTVSCVGPYSVTFVGDVISNQTCANRYTITRTYMVTDFCGSSAFCTQTILVNDQTPPTITCPTVTATIQCPATPSFPAATATDLCGGTSNINFTDITTPGGLCAQAYSVTRTWTANDNCGNTATCSRTIAVVDNTPPVINCPTVTATIQCPATPNFPAATATDLCGGTPTINFTDLTTPGGLCAQAYSVTRTWTANDNCGNTATCSRTIAVVDNTPPVINCPTVTSTIECPATPNFAAATATDLCGGTPIINFTDLITPSGFCTQSYSVTRTWTATDNCGNTSTCSRIIFVTDNTAPIISCPTVVSPVECPFVPASFGTATATDLCDATTTIGFSDVFTTGGICLQNYSVTRSWVATDGCGNSSTCSRTIFVTDNTAPVITCPTVIPTIACPATPVFPAASASDLCSGTAIISFTDITTPGGICAQSYSITRTWIAMDNCGNSATCSRTIAVTDLTEPVITCPTVTENIECPATPVFGIATATDLCGTVNPVITFTDFTTQSGICSQQYSVTRIWTATDNCGNASTCSRSISVTDNTPPVIQNPPANILADCSDLLPVLNLTAIDLCSGNAPVLMISEVQTPGICPILFTILRTWSATDACGNSSTMSQTVTMTENSIPEFTTQAADLTLECDQLTNLDHYQNWLDSHAGATILDCSNITWTYMDSPLITNPSECGSTFQKIIRFTATDACGNSAFQDAIFTVADLTPPVFTVLPTHLEVECVEGYNGDIAMSDWIEHFGYAQVNDKCGSVATKVVFINEIPGCGNTFTRNYEFRATDECGNTNYVRASFSVVDHTGPVIVKCPEGNVLLTCEFDVPPPDYAGVITTDNCGAVTVTANTYSTGVGCKFWPKTISYWYMATDECHNMTVSCDQSFHIIDSIPPIYTGPDTIKVVCVQDLPGSGAATDYLAPYFVDNCYDLICTGSKLAQNDVNSVTYSVQSKDLCGNWAACFPVTFIATGGCKPICAATQTMWGNKSGVINGVTTTEAIDKFMLKYGGVTVGKLHKSMTATSADCIHQMLPGNGNTAQFNPGIYTFGQANNCLPGSPLLNIDGTLKNKLATNIIAMQFNVWYNLEYNERNLGVQELAKLPPCLVHQIVMNKLETDHVTVQELLNLSNDYLAGVGAFPPNFGNLLNSALENLNKYWENCQINNPCASKSRAGTYAETNLYNLSLAPNPVSDLATITFEIASDAELVVRFVSNTGIQSESLNQVVIGFNSLSFSTKNFPAGIYTIVLQQGKDLQTLRMVKVGN